MKITALVENTSCSEVIEQEHGLSVLVETEKDVVLFDTGCGEMFLRNAGRLGVDLTSVKHLVLSHGHYDHAGGIPAFLKVNSGAKVYVRPEVFIPTYAQRESGVMEYIGVPQGLKDSGRLVFTHDGMVIAPGVTLYSAFVNTEPIPKTNHGLLKENGGGMSPDDFRHEQIAEFREDGKTLLLSGCSHNGIGNILRNYGDKSGRLPDVVIGGFHLHSHLTGAANGKVLDDTAAAIAESGAMSYTCHCTGLPSYQGLKERLGDRIGYLCGGQTITM